MHPEIFNSIPEELHTCKASTPILSGRWKAESIYNSEDVPIEWMKHIYGSHEVREIHDETQINLFNFSLAVSRRLTRDQ
jgi:hypothetical protein